MRAAMMMVDRCDSTNENEEKGEKGKSKRHTCHTLNFVAHPKMGHEHNFWGDKDVFRRIMESAGFVIGMSKRKYLEIFMPYIAR